MSSTSNAQPIIIYMPPNKNETELILEYGEKVNLLFFNTKPINYEKIIQILQDTGLKFNDNTNTIEGTVNCKQSSIIKIPIEYDGITINLNLKFTGDCFDKWFRYLFKLFSYFIFLPALPIGIIIFLIFFEQQIPWIEKLPDIVIDELLLKKLFMMYMAILNGFTLTAFLELVRSGITMITRFTGMLSKKWGDILLGCFGIAICIALLLFITPKIIEINKMDFKDSQTLFIISAIASSFYLEYKKKKIANLSWIF